MEEETNVLISGHLQHLTPEGETSDDNSNGSDDVSSTLLYDKVSSSCTDEDDMAILISNTNLGINLELDLDITHEDMLQDETSTPLDD